MTGDSNVYFHFFSFFISALPIHGRNSAKMDSNTIYFTIIILIGVRRLRRRASDPKYPEMKALERIFNELEYSSGNVLQDA